MKENYFSKETNRAYGLKLKPFMDKLEDSESAEGNTHYAAWIQAVFSERGSRIGWYVSFNHEVDDALYHLLNDKGEERIFKTSDAAINFYLALGINTGANVRWV